MEGNARPTAGVELAVLRGVLKSQYHAALSMLQETIEQCPDDLWLSEAPRNSYWQLVYHALYYAHLYLLPDEGAFRPWAGHQADVQHPDGIPGRADPDSSLPLIPRPYTRSQALAYCKICDGMVDEAVDALDLNSPDCGFSWYQMTKLEHQIMGIRHIQHHTAQLADRLRSATGRATRWAGAGRPDPKGH